MPRELSDIYEVNVDEDYSMGQILGVGGLCGMLIWALLFYTPIVPELERQAVVAATSTEEVSEYGGGVLERDGALWYPDGQPVRNYEQLDIYLHGAH